MRIDPKLLREAKRVANEIGLTPGDIVRMLFTQLVKLRGLPFRPSEFPALEEYGASMADVEFTGKLP